MNYRTKLAAIAAADAFNKIATNWDERVNRVHLPGVYGGRVRMRLRAVPLHGNPNQPAAPAYHNPYEPAAPADYMEQRIRNAGG